MTGVSLSETARAKVNLALHVVGRRADGYHLLDMLIGFAGIGDVLTARPAEGLSLRVTGPGAEALADTDPNANLVMRAARALADLVAADGYARPGAAITLEKRLPVAGGIGGGSADGAAALRLLCRLWDVDPGRPELAGIARALGADVTMCVVSRPLRAEGIGHDLTLAGPFPPLGLLLVNPGVPMSTPAVFGALTHRDGQGLPGLPKPNDAAALFDWLRATRNDLQAPAIAMAPQIGDVLARLAELPGARFVRMSGSGATCFALFDEPSAAVAAADIVAAERSDWWIAASPLG